jgi:hypothetical protein
MLTVKTWGVNQVIGEILPDLRKIFRVLVLSPR